MERERNGVSEVMQERWVWKDRQTFNTFFHFICIGTCNIAFNQAKKSGHLE